MPCSTKATVLNLARVTKLMAVQHPWALTSSPDDHPVTELSDPSLSGASPAGGKFGGRTDSCGDLDQSPSEGRAPLGIARTRSDGPAQTRSDPVICGKIGVSPGTGIETKSSSSRIR